MPLLLAGASAFGGEIIRDNYNVTGSGTGFALGNGANSGINPPVTRLTGPAAAAGLRYMNTAAKAGSAYSITSNKLRVTAAANPGRFVLSTDGANPYSFSSALDTGGATPAHPAVYDVTISMNNNSAGTQRFSFALGTQEGDANSWDFGLQVYRAAAGNNFYTIGKRIDTTASGLGVDLNEAIYTMGAGTYGTEINLLMRVTDAGNESATFNSRLQLSLNGGSSWIYDTATDPDLAGTGWRLNGSGRYFMWDAAPDAGPVTYDNFSITTPTTPAGPETNSVIRVMTYNIHFGTDPNGVVDTQRTADFILAQQADLVCLNEVERFRARSDNRDLIGEIAAKTGLNFIFSNNVPSAGANEFGNAILSKYPILSREHRLLPRLGDNEQRGCLKAVVDVNGKFISFWATHLAFVADDTERLMAVTNFNTWVDDETLPVLICGDFNETPDKNVHDVMDQKWDDCWLLAGSGLGRTVPCPGPALHRIDFIWKAEGAPLQPTNALVSYAIEASDHFPVLIGFVLTNATRHASGFNFPFNQGAGNKVVDVISALTGKFDASAPAWSTNSPSGLPGDFSLYFDGSKKVTVPDPAQLIGTNGVNGDYTAQTWVKLPLNFAPATRMVMFQYERSPGFSFSINTNRTLHTTAFKQQDIASSAAVPNDGQWHHVAVVHTDGVGMKFYIDAVLAATIPYTNGHGFRTSATVTVGAAAEGANWFTGYLDRVRFENHALTPTQFDFPAVTFATWAAFYGLVDPNIDSDGDGQNNFAEYTARTNPTNAASVFKMVGAERQSEGAFTLTWSSVGGKRYRIQSSDSLNTPFTDIVRDIVTETDPAPAGQPSTQTFTDNSSSPDGIRYYRVKVIP